MVKIESDCLLVLALTHLFNVDRLKDGVDVSVDVVVDDVLVLRDVGGVGVQRVERAGRERDELRR